MKIIRIPSSKSIAHRAMICAAFAPGKSVIEPICLSEDAEATLRCISALGADCRLEEKRLTIWGISKHRRKACLTKAAPFFMDCSKMTSKDILLDCGESGSTLRFLLPAALLSDRPYSLTGRGRLMERPLDPYLKALENNGARFIREGNFLRVRGPIHPGVYQMPGNISSQFITGLLMTLPLLEGDSELVLTNPLESRSYVDLTLSVAEAFGVTVERAGEQKFKVPGRQTYSSCTYTVESDFSGAAFFLVAGALGFDVECLGLNKRSLQGDRAILDILKACGAGIEYTKRGGIRAFPGDLAGLTVDARDIPDLVPPLAVLLCFSRGESKIINAGRLRMKESDRLHALAAELNSIGARITEGEDRLEIQGVERIRGGEADSHNDHRIAMALAVASLRSEEPVKIAGSSCVNKSYPSFWEDFGGKERVIRA